MKQSTKNASANEALLEAYKVIATLFMQYHVSTTDTPVLYPLPFR